MKMEMFKSLLDGNKYKFGAPWIMPDKTLVTVPILTSLPTKARKYAMIDEVQDKVKITDLGTIGKIEVYADTDKPVFIRMGSLFEGKGTQSRGMIKSRIILPRIHETIEVKCVYASSGISQGAQFKYSPVTASSGLYPALHMSCTGKVDQSAVWSSVKNSLTYACSGSNIKFDGTTDYIGAMKKVDEFRKEINAAIEKMPLKTVNQVGLAILNGNGVQGIEMFNSPDSWKAVAKCIVKKYTDNVIDEDKAGVFKVDKTQIKPTLMKFLKSVLNVDINTVEDCPDYKYEIFDEVNMIGEVFTLHKEEIYSIAAKKQVN